MSSTTTNRRAAERITLGLVRADGLAEGLSTADIQRALRAATLEEVAQWHELARLIVENIARFTRVIDAEASQPMVVNQWLGAEDSS